jgi:hypothetical protein
MDISVSGERAVSIFRIEVSKDAIRLNKYVSRKRVTQSPRHEEIKCNPVRVRILIIFTYTLNKEAASPWKPVRWQSQGHHNLNNLCREDFRTSTNIGSSEKLSSLFFRPPPRKVGGCNRWVGQSVEVRSW